MLFRPSYCANCGEKIEREEWRLLTSRRFCELCETEFKAHDLIPRVVVGLGALAMIFGFGSYLKSGPDTMSARQLRGVPERPPSVQTVPANPAAGVMQQTNINSTVSQTSNTGGPEQTTRAVDAMQPPKHLSGDRETIAEPAYYCGAQTRKGTPCTRRVKGNIRCYQHTGMPAMLPPEKLKVG
jgi:hypothetical protein